MIWTLKVECECGRFLEEECIRLIEIDSHASLYDLHEIIQEAVHFDDDHLFEFYAGKNFRKQKIVFVEDAWGCGYDGGVTEYSNITLEDIYPLSEGLQLFYLFDFGDDWFFKITKSRSKPKEPEKGITYPRIIEKIGPDPEQYPDWEEE